MTIELTRLAKSGLADPEHHPHIVPEVPPLSPPDVPVLKPTGGAADDGGAADGGGRGDDGREHDDPELPLIDTVLSGKHRIIREIGRGGTGRVYKAEHCFLQRFEAVKVLHRNLCADGESLQRFQVEARATSTLRHENLIAVTDFGITEAKQPYLVMDYIEGESLAELIKQHGRLDVKQFVELFSQICRGLDHAHQKGIIHRDLKPSNIMISKTADDKTLVRILDFGTAKILHTDLSAPQNLTHTGEIFGSPLYMSPEQCRGAQVDCRSDIYSLGCVMFEALTGEPPIQSSNSIEILYKHLSGSAPTLSKAFPELKIPFALENIVSKAMAHNVQHRYATSAELEKDLSSAQINLDSGKKVALRRPVSTQPSKHVPKLTLPLIASLLVLVLGVAANFPKIAASLNIKQATSAANKASQLTQAKLMAEAANEKEQKDRVAAYQYAKRALAIRAALAPNSPEHAFSLDQVGNIAYHLSFKEKDPDHAFKTEAESCLKKAVEMAPVVPGDTDSGKLQYMRDLARFYLFEDIHKSAALLEEVRKTAGLTDDQLVYPKNGTFMYDLQTLYVRQGNYVAAAKLEVKRDLARTTKDQMKVPASPDFAGDWKVYEPDTVGIDGNNLHLRIKNAAAHRLKIDLKADGTYPKDSDPNAAGYFDNAAVAQVVWKLTSTNIAPQEKAAIVRIGRFLVWFIPNNSHLTGCPNCCVLTRNKTEVK